MNPKIIDRMYNDSASLNTKVRIPKKDFKTSKDRVNYARNMALFALAAAEINKIKKAKTNSRQLTEHTRRKQRALAAAEINKISTNSRKLTNFERRKQHKVRYDTWRRQEMPNEEDMSLENIHYANFLGDKYCDNGAPYNTEYPVNVRFCDSRVEEAEEEAKEEAKDEDSLARRAREMDELDSLGRYGRKHNEPFSDEDSNVDPHAYINEYAEDDEQSIEDDMSALSLGSDSDLWSLDDGDKQYCPGDDVDATSERIASAFIDMHKLTQYYMSHIATAIDIYNEFENINKRDIGQAYDEEQAPEPALKRARCDDESYNV
jgi:hypothetical protein